MQVVAFAEGLRFMRCMVKWLVLLSALAAPSPSSASGCKEDLAALEAMLSEATLDADRKAQAQDMRKQAAALCAAGNEEASSDVIAEARAFLDAL